MKRALQAVKTGAGWLVGKGRARGTEWRGGRGVEEADGSIIGVWSALVVLLLLRRLPRDAIDPCAMTLLRARETKFPSVDHVPTVRG